VKSIFLILPLFSLLAVAAAHADDSFAVLPQQVVSVGDGSGDTFLLESISRNDNSVVLLLRPKGEDCNFRFVLGVGRSVQLRVDAPTGQLFLCKTTLRPIVDDKNVQFGAECTEQPASHERKCPPEGSTACERPSRLMEPLASGLWRRSWAERCSTKPSAPSPTTGY
jgi:hypothetical protein